MSKSPDVVQYILWTLSSYEKDDIDSDDFDVAFENEQGVEGFATCSVTESAADALSLIELVTKQRDELLAAAEQAISECADLISTPAGDALTQAIAKAKVGAA